MTFQLYEPPFLTGSHYYSTHYENYLVFVQASQLNLFDIFTKKINLTYDLPCPIDTLAFTKNSNVVGLVHSTAEGSALLIFDLKKKQTTYHRIFQEKIQKIQFSLHNKYIILIQ